MADLDAIARPYARAVFDLARAAGTLDVWSHALAVAADAAASPDVARLTNTPGVDPQAVASVIIDFGLREVQHPDREQFRNFIRVVAENRRLTAIPAIYERFDELKADVENTMDVVLTAATRVSEEQQQRIVQSLKQRFGREVRLEFQLDESMIGGARLRANDLVIDGSVRARLEKMASALVH